jgi:hypothetical protein
MWPSSSSAVLAAALLLLLAPPGARAQVVALPFSSSTFVVSRVGSGASALTATLHYAVSLHEFT